MGQWRWGNLPNRPRPHHILILLFLVAVHIDTLDRTSKRLPPFCRPNDDRPSPFAMHGHASQALCLYPVSDPGVSASLAPLPPPLN